MELFLWYITRALHSFENITIIYNHISLYIYIFYIYIYTYYIYYIYNIYIFIYLFFIFLFISLFNYLHMVYFLDLVR